MDHEWLSHIYPLDEWLSHIYIYPIIMIIPYEWLIYGYMDIHGIMNDYGIMWIWENDQQTKISKINKDCWRTDLWICFAHMPNSRFLSSLLFFSSFSSSSSRLTRLPRKPWNKMPEKISGRMLGAMSDRAFDKMPDFYQNMCQIECQNSVRWYLKQSCGQPCNWDYVPQ